MKITDEQLSAFLDGELSPAEMETIRNQIAGDPAVADRLAALALADHAVREHASHETAKSTPTAILKLLEESDNVVRPSLWQRTRAKLNEQVAMAAGVALVIGFGFGQLLPALTNDTDAAGYEPSVVRVLEQQPSGQEYALADDLSVLPRLTFMSRDGNYCRQFQIRQGAAQSEQIACRTGSAEWQQIAMVKNPDIRGPGNYQTASGGSLLDSTLDSMMASAGLNRNAEQDLISAGWQRSNKEE